MVTKVSASLRYRLSCHLAARLAQGVNSDLSNP